MNPKIIFGTAVFTASIFNGYAMAQQLLRDDPNRPVSQISADLAVTPAEFTACFRHVTPVQGGEPPTEAHAQANKAILLPCLQAANADISNALLDAVMDTYRR